MPIIKSIKGKRCRIECWTISESTADLERLCASSLIKTVNNFALESRYQQFMATQLLFKILFEKGTLKYHNSGKPYVEGVNSEYVSISHCGNMVVMMKAQEECGVDIERIHPRVAKVKHKFLNDEELGRVNDEDVYTLVQYWTAKEAMFKVYGSQEVFMRSNIAIDNVQSGRANANLREGELTLIRDICYQIIDDMLLAWTEKSHEE